MYKNAVVTDVQELKLKFKKKAVYKEKTTYVEHREHMFYFHL